MKTIHYTLLLAALALMCSCGGNDEGNKKPVRVKVQQVGAVQVNGEHGYSGTVVEESGTNLSFTVGGTILNMAVDEGQMVGRGQLIATLNPTDQASALQSAHAVTEQARQALNQAQDTYNRSKGLHEAGVISDAKWVQAQTALEEATQGVKSAEALETIARKSSEDTNLTAPYAGYIAEKSAEAGQNVLPGVTVARLVHIDQVKVKISVPESEIGQMAIGETMMLRCDAVGDSVFYGKIDVKGVAADPLSRTYEVKLMVDNPNHKLLPGMICNVYSRFTEGQTGVFVPVQVVQLNPDNRMFVWVVKDGKATKRFINYISDTSQGIRVSGGLEPGDQLIIEGQQKVSEGTVCEIID